MKVTVINGQNHKGSTWNMGNILAKKLSSDVKEFFLPRDFGEFCCGCTNCFVKNENLCPHYEKLKPITDAIDEADVLIFTTPVYVYHCTGSMKAFLDHYGYRWLIHRPEAKMFSKQAVILSTAAGAGMKSANKDIKDSMFFWGIAKTYCYGKAVMAVSWDTIQEKKKIQIEKKLDSIAGKIKSHNGKIKPSIKTRVFFSIMGKFHKSGFNKADDKYWEEKYQFGKIKPWNL